MKKKELFKTPAEKFKYIDSLISSVSNLSPTEKQELTLKNIFNLISNVEIVKK